ncbi:MAG TPA: hypothetical protein VGP72_31630 [Planctomycetota bacterium]
MTEQERLASRIETRTYILASERENADKEIAQAIATMERAVEDAKRCAKETDRSSIRKTLAVMHALAWGHANATSNLENALTSAERQHETEMNLVRFQADAAAIASTEAK